MGGFTGSQYFSSAVAPENVTAFVDTTVQFMSQNNLGCLEIEYVSSVLLPFF
jgi:GH18 family chitinase